MDLDLLSSQLRFNPLTAGCGNEDTDAEDNCMNEDSEDLNNPNLSGCDRLLTSPGSASDNGGTINTGTSQPYHPYLKTSNERPIF